MYRAGDLARASRCSADGSAGVSDASASQPENAASRAMAATAPPNRRTSASSRSGVNSIVRAKLPESTPCSSAMACAKQAREAVRLGPTVRRVLRSTSRRTRARAPRPRPRRRAASCRCRRRRRPGRRLPLPVATARSSNARTCAQARRSARRAGRATAGGADRTRRVRARPRGHGWRSARTARAGPRSRDPRPPGGRGPPRPWPRRAGSRPDGRATGCVPRS